MKRRVVQDDAAGEPEDAIARLLVAEEYVEEFGFEHLSSINPADVERIIMLLVHAVRQMDMEDREARFAANDRGVWGRLDSV